MQRHQRRRQRQATVATAAAAAAAAERLALTAVKMKAAGVAETGTSLAAAETVTADETGAAVAAAVTVAMAAAGCRQPHTGRGQLAILLETELSLLPLLSPPKVRPALMKTFLICHVRKIQWPAHCQKIIVYQVHFLAVSLV